MRLTNQSVSRGSRAAARPWGRRAFLARLDKLPPVRRRPVTPFLSYAIGTVPELASILAAALVNVTLNRRGAL